MWVEGGNKEFEHIHIEIPVPSLPLAHAQVNGLTVKMTLDRLLKYFLKKSNVELH